ncbi:sugar transferase [Sphaerochaeta sp. PS]|uniref:sugar transferase n=1 Tax=Sphaerochaeta sp. PS TaxID=3076336 RepID=UPI0028A43EF1|nr:sugar transferase [Sphaerochaeta sp. PS]MDT4763365.1 sugar transferase [Sphaerochaeta sp. PS]
MAFLVMLLFLFQYLYADRLTIYRTIQFLITDISLVSFIFIFHGFELNTLKSKNAVLISTVLGSFLGVLVGMFFTILIFGANRDVYRHEFIATTIAASLAIPILSLLYYRIVISKIPSLHCIVIGDKSIYGSLLAEVEESAQGKILIEQWASSVEQARGLFKDISHKVIIIANLQLFRELSLEVYELEKKGVQKFYITEVVEDWLYRIPLTIAEEYRDYYEIFFNQTPISQEKRIMDIVFGLVMGIIAIPFILLFGILVVLNSGFPVIFKQKRVGLYEEPFMFYKIRSLKEDKQLENSGNPNGTITQRLTFVGKILRKTRIDEFPQFMNILNGTMSVVGPRPEMGIYHDKWKETIPFYGFRNMVRPGLTGWAQINYGHTTTLEEYIRKTEYDLYYVKHKSLSFDIQIIMKTFETFLGMKGGR